MKNLPKLTFELLGIRDLPHMVLALTYDNGEGRRHQVRCTRDHGRFDVPNMLRAMANWVEDDREP